MLVAYPPHHPVGTSHPRSANNAGSPLPCIPRRISAPASHIQVMVQAPSPPCPPKPSSKSEPSDSDSDSDESDEVPIASRQSPQFNADSTIKLRAHGQKQQQQPIPLPSASRGRSNHSALVGKLSNKPSGQVDFGCPRATLPPRSASVSSLTHQPVPMPGHTRAQTISIPSSVEAKLILKKSGEPLKSSLKSSRSTPRPTLSISTFGPSPSTKSEPVTPSASKNVHFDAQLEHVKHFLAEQKPLAVSRDGSPTGSPTTDTSGTESDFPSFIFDKFSRDRTSRDKPSLDKPQLALTKLNMPTIIRQDADVVLESVSIANGSELVVGLVRVRNIAYHKWVVIRFTLDHWQTTSEVSARYEDSPSSAFDRFGFTIRLDGLLGRFEGREMILAVRFSVDGREMWDNNDGHNYRLGFSLVQLPKDHQPIAAIKEQNANGPRTAGAIQQRSTASSSDVGEDLKTKLQEVVIQRWDSKIRAEQQATAAPSFRSTNSLAPRYDFASSWKNNSWSANSVPWPGDNKTSPTPLPRRMTKPTEPLGSPRDLDKEAPFRPATAAPSDPSSVSPSRPRNHHRGGGYFDSAFTSSGSPHGFTKTSPTGTPGIHSLNDMSSPRPFHSYALSPPSGLPTPPSVKLVGSLKKLVLPRAEIVSLTLPKPPQEGGVLSSSEIDFLEVPSAASTPSMVSPTSTSNSSPAGSPSLEDLRSPLSILGGEASKSQDYRELLNRFCFYTGTPSSESGPTLELVHSSSVSSVEKFLLSASNSSPRIHPAISPSPSRSSITPSSSTDTLRCIFPV